MEGNYIENMIVQHLKMILMFFVALIVCSCISLLASCSSRVTDRLSVETINTESAIHSIDSTLTLKSDTSYIFHTSSTLDWWECDFTITDYSTPDSAGHQYPVSVKKGTAKGGSKKNDTTTIENRQNEIACNIKENNEMNVSQENRVEKEQKKESPNFPLWFWIAPWIAIIMFVLFTIVWLKKKGYY